MALPDGLASPTRAENRRPSIAEVLTRSVLGWGQQARRWLPAGIIAAGIIGLWEAVVAFNDIPAWKLPAPSAIGLELWTSRELLLGHTLITAEEVLIGFALALVSGRRPCLDHQPVQDAGAGDIPRSGRLPDHTHHSHCSAAAHLGGVWDSAQDHCRGVDFLFPHRGQHRGRPAVRRPGYGQPPEDPWSQTDGRSSARSTCRLHYHSCSPGSR